MTANETPQRRTRVLFVCLGNICRSPLAEGVFLHLVKEAGVADRFEVASAGTGEWHIGERPDPRSIAVAKRHGVELPSRARQVKPKDLETFDHVIAMDRENLRELRRMAQDGAKANLRLLREHDPARRSNDDNDVPDPYYGGPTGFDLVYDMVHRSCTALLADLTTEPSHEA